MYARKDYRQWRKKHDYFLKSTVFQLNNHTISAGKECAPSTEKYYLFPNDYPCSEKKIINLRNEITQYNRKNMATILKSNEREFMEDPGKIDNFRLFSDISRIKKGINPQNLNFDLKQLNPGQYSSTYHFHRYAEELFMIISGSSTLRTPDGLEIINSGDLLFFEKGETGAHQLYNHTSEACIYLDIRTFIGYDICEYPDSNKLFIVPTYEIFNKESQVNYFDGEENVKDKWKQIENLKP